MSDSFEDIMAGVLDDVPDLVVDPEMQKAIDRVREINEILRTTECSDSELHEYLAEADVLWQEWHNETLLVNGTVYFTLEGENASRAIDLRGVSVRSDSFCITRKPPEGKFLQIVHDLYVHPLDVFSDDDPVLALYESLDPESMPLINAIAPLETLVDTLDFTSERALQYMELYYSEFVAEVDRRIMLTGGSSEALLALRGIELSQYLDMESEVTKTALMAYLDSLILTDKGVPHKFMLASGEIYATVDNKGEKVAVPTTGGEVFHAHVVSGLHLPGRVNGEIRHDVLVIDTRLVSEDDRETGRVFCVPIDTISTMNPDRPTLLAE